MSTIFSQMGNVVSTALNTQKDRISDLESISTTLETRATDLEAGVTGVSGGILQTQTTIDATSRSIGTGWTETFATEYVTIKDTSEVKVMARIAGRNDGETWGGGYLRLDIDRSLGNGWETIGDQGYTTTMTQNGWSIDTSTTFIHINRAMLGTATQIKFRMVSRSYQGTFSYNGDAAASGSINGITTYLGKASIVVDEIGKSNGN